MAETKKKTTKLKEPTLKELSIGAKLAYIQQNLDVPKGQYNKHGGFNYRSLEDIFTALKPLLKETHTYVTVSDDLVAIGDRYYVKAEAALHDIQGSVALGNLAIGNVAFARETLERKGMGPAQITGSASSYARKYAMNGLFAIDDVKDDDTRDNKKTEKAKEAVKEPTPNKTKLGELLKEMMGVKAVGKEAMVEFLGSCGIEWDGTTMSESAAQKIYLELKKLNG